MVGRLSYKTYTKKIKKRGGASLLPDQTFKNKQLEYLENINKINIDYNKIKKTRENNLLQCKLHGIPPKEAENCVARTNNLLAEIDKSRTKKIDEANAVIAEAIKEYEDAKKKEQYNPGWQKEQMEIDKMAVAEATKAAQVAAEVAAEALHNSIWEPAKLEGTHKKESETMAAAQKAATIAVVKAKGTKDPFYAAQIELAKVISESKTKNDLAKEELARTVARTDA